MVISSASGSASSAWRADEDDARPQRQERAHADLPGVRRHARLPAPRSAHRGPPRSRRVPRAPLIPEIAQRAGISEDEVIEAIDAGSAYRSTSLDAGRSDDEEAPGLLGQLGSLDPEMASAERRAALGPLIGSLPEREQVMLY